MFKFNFSIEASTGDEAMAFIAKLGAAVAQGSVGSLTTGPANKKRKRKSKKGRDERRRKSVGEVGGGGNPLKGKKAPKLSKAEAEKGQVASKQLETSAEHPIPGRRGKKRNASKALTKPENVRADAQEPRKRDGVTGSQRPQHAAKSGGANGAAGRSNVGGPRKSFQPSDKKGKVGGTQVKTGSKGGSGRSRITEASTQMGELNPADTVIVTPVTTAAKAGSSRPNEEAPDQGSGKKRRRMSNDFPSLEMMEQTRSGNKARVRSG